MNFETPNAQAAYFAGMTIEQFEASIDAQAAEMETLREQNRPDLAVEDRPSVSASDMHPMDWEN